MDALEGEGEWEEEEGEEEEGEIIVTMTPSRKSGKIAEKMGWKGTRMMSQRGGEQEMTESLNLNPRK